MIDSLLHCQIMKRK